MDSDTPQVPGPPPLIPCHQCDEEFHYEKDKKNHLKTVHQKSVRLKYPGDTGELMSHLVILVISNYLVYHHILRAINGKFRCLHCSMETNDPDTLGRHAREERCPYFKKKDAKTAKRLSTFQISSSLVSEAATVLPTEIDLPTELDLPSSADITVHRAGLLEILELSEISKYFRVLSETGDIVCLACEAVLPHQRIAGHIDHERFNHQKCSISESQYQDLVDVLAEYAVDPEKRREYFLDRQFQGPIPGVKINTGYKCNICPSTSFLSLTKDGLARHQILVHREDPRRLDKDFAKGEEISFQIVYEQDGMSTRYRVSAVTDPYHQERVNKDVDMQPHLDHFRELGKITRYLLHF
jgi:hypothetical protein